MLYYFLLDNLLGIDCGDPSAPGNGTVTASTTTVGSTAVYACLDGFQLMGAASVECSSTGDWSDYPPKCMLITCPPLESPSNGSVSISDGTAAGSNATFFCEVGYELLGEATLQCLDTGSWTSPPPQCVLKNCGPIEAPMNGSVSFPDGTTVGAIATFTCEIGFQLLGEDSVQCLEDGSWSDSAPTCEIRGMCQRIHITRKHVFRVFNKA